MRVALDMIILIILVEKLVNSLYLRAGLYLSIKLCLN